MEEAFLALCEAHEISRPAVNVGVGRYEVDFLWREQKLAIETDGRETHGTRAAFEADRARRRADRGRLQGRALHVPQVLSEPAFVGRLVQTLIEN